LYRREASGEEIQELISAKSNKKTNRGQSPLQCGGQFVFHWLLRIPKKWAVLGTKLQKFAGGIFGDITRDF
jgi:hypothetical protein